MILPPKRPPQHVAAPFGVEVLGRLPLAEAFYTAWAHVAPDHVLEEIFERHRGRCYTDTLTFPEIVLALAGALTRYHGSANRSIEKAHEGRQLSVQARAVYGKLSRLPLPLAEALLSGLTARLRPLFPAGLFRNDVPPSLRGLHLVVLDGKKIKRAAKRLLALRGRPGKLFGGKVLVAYSPIDGLAVALAADADGEANDVRLLPRALALARDAVGAGRLWIADRQFCDLDQPGRFAEGGDHYLVRFSKRCNFSADGQRPKVLGVNDKGQAVVQEWGWLGAAADPRRRYVRRITLERGKEEAVTLVTDLLDEEAYPAVDLLLAYLMRWQIEAVFQEITEVFELRHLIGCTPKATVFQASLCLVIYNVLQLLRGHATVATRQREAEAARREEARGREGPTARVDDVSSEKVFLDLHEELISLHTTLQEEEILSCLPAPLPVGEARERLAERVDRAWSPFWRKAKNNRPRPAKPKARQSGAHTSVHKVLQEARAAKQREKSITASS
jgi:Transposase DDE domain